MSTLDGCYNNIYCFNQLKTSLIPWQHCMQLVIMYKQCPNAGGTGVSGATGGTGATGETGDNQFQSRTIYVQARLDGKLTLEDKLNMPNKAAHGIW